jgi:hypothetical protein
MFARIYTRARACTQRHTHTHWLLQRPCLHSHTQIRTDAHTHIHTHVRVYTQRHTCVRTCNRTNIHTCARVFAHKYTHMHCTSSTAFARAYTHTHTHARARACVSTHTYIHTRLAPRRPGLHVLRCQPWSRRLVSSHQELQARRPRHQKAWLLPAGRQSVPHIYLESARTIFIYTVYVRCYWQGNHQMYGHIRCIFTHSRVWPTLHIVNTQVNGVVCMVVVVLVVLVVQASLRVINTATHTLFHLHTHTHAHTHMHTRALETKREAAAPTPVVTY